MTTGSDQHGTAFLRDGRVFGPWTCLRCKYGIENLKPTDPCPECGGPLDQSLDPRLLRFAPPTIINRVRRGARGIELTVLAAILSIPAIAIYFATVEALESRGSLSLALSYLLTGPVFPLVLVYGVMLLLARSVFRYTTPLPASCEPPRAAAQLRRVLRYSVIAVPVMFTPFAAIIVLEWLWSVYLERVVPGWVAVLVASSMVGTTIALAFGLSLYAWSIGERTWAYGKPLTVIARAPALFAVIAATISIPVAVLAEFSIVLMYASVWGLAQWMFFSFWLAWILFGVLAMLLSLLTVEAVRSAAKRDFREASAARAAVSSSNEDRAP
jgi:hypothetical protein